MKPSLPQGTRDFGPHIVRKRRHIFDTIRKVFELYGFQPLETPAMENLETLQGKYGEEGDKLIFKVLNNGLQNPAKHATARAAFEKALDGKSTTGLTERALKYDLTIPFARFVAMNHGNLIFPYKRYQMQPVWRADRPQKGRYREFFQCDADVVGSRSLVNEVEFIHMYSDVFERLQLRGCTLHLNNRKVLRGIMEICGTVAEEKEILISIDKMDKIGIEGVQNELSKTFSPEVLEQLFAPFFFKGNNSETITFLKSFLASSAIGLEGTGELEWVLQHVIPSAPAGDEQLTGNCIIDLTLARGLEYYTGTIFEVKAPPVIQIGSIGGGGRYDDLTGLFGVAGIPGVGISFGVDRIFDVLEELQLFPETLEQNTRVLFFNLGLESAAIAMKCLREVRLLGIAAEIFHENAKLDKQFKYAEKKGIPYVVTVANGTAHDMDCTVKNILTGDQQRVPLAGLAATLADIAATAPAASGPHS